MLTFKACSVAIFSSVTSISDRGPYEWYQDYNSLSHLLNPLTLSGCYAAPNPQGNLIFSSGPTTAPVTLDFNHTNNCLQPPDCRVLVLGCGNSQLGQHMYEAGWASNPGSRFVQLDFSSVVIDQMKARYNDQYYETLWGAGAKQCPRMDFVCCDVTEGLPYEDGSFDLIICKGIFDAILCSLGSLCSIRRLVKDCIRLLDGDSGVLFVCTYGNPDSRVVFLEDKDGGYEEYWRSVSVEKLPSRVGISHQRNSNSNK